MRTYCVCYGFLFFLMIRRPPRSTRTDTLFPDTTLFRSAGPRLLPARAALSAPHRNLACHRRGRAVPALRRLCRDETARLPALAALRRLGQPRALHRLCGDRVDGHFHMAARQLAPCRARSDERRVGTEWCRRGRTGWWPVNSKKKKIQI